MRGRGRGKESEGGRERGSEETSETWKFALSLEEFFLKRKRTDLINNILIYSNTQRLHFRANMLLYAVSFLSPS